MTNKRKNEKMKDYARCRSFQNAIFQKTTTSLIVEVDDRNFFGKKQKMQKTKKVILVFFFLKLELIWKNKDKSIKDGDDERNDDSSKLRLTKWNIHWNRLNELSLFLFCVFVFQLEAKQMLEHQVNFFPLQLNFIESLSFD